MAHTVEVVVAAKDIPLGAKLERRLRQTGPLGARQRPRRRLHRSAGDSRLVRQGRVHRQRAGRRQQAVHGRKGLRRDAAADSARDACDVGAGRRGRRTSQASSRRIRASTSWSRSQARARASRSFSRIVLQNIEVLAVAQEIQHVKDEPEVVKVVTLLVTPHRRRET